MATAAVQDLRAKSDKSLARLKAQLAGMEPHLERADAPGEWTTRQVLCHLLGAPERDPVAMLRGFAEHDLPVVEIKPGDVHVTPERQKMTLGDLVGALEGQQRAVFAYLEGLDDRAIEARKARIPLFKQFMGTDEISLAAYVGAMFGFHWKDHTGQLAKIRQAAGLPTAG